MKKFIFPFILLLLIGIEIYYLDDITLYVSKILNSHPDVIIGAKNEYTKDYDFLYVKDSKDFIPFSYGDVKNIFYSIINNGWEEFTFYCPEEYSNCIKDVQIISNNATVITNINNFANPLNSFMTINTSFSDSGEVNVSLTRLYDDNKIKEIDKITDDIIKNNTNNSMNIKDKIKAIHDYIINTTDYDIERNDNGDSQYESNTAYGLFFQHKAICSGYADGMAIILSKLGIENFKIASGTHVWNALKLDGNWYHLDLTWDDPVTDSGSVLDYKYFLVDNDELKSADGELEEHKFDKSVYLEFK